MKPEIRWPLFIVGLLVCQVGMGLFFLWKATSDRSFAVEEDYYRKAVEWEDRQAQDRVNEELGWRLAPEVGPLGDDGATRRLAASLATSDGQPLTGAALRVEAFHNVRAGDIQHVDLAEVKAGEYEALLPMRRPGLWELRFTADLAERTFTHRARIHVPQLRR